MASAGGGHGATRRDDLPRVRTTPVSWPDGSSLEHEWVELPGGLVWQPHTVGFGDERADAQLRLGYDGPVVRQLDVCTTEDTCCVPGESAERARAEWEAGRVLAEPAEPRHGVPTLVVPEHPLTAELACEALRRFAP